MDLDQAEKLLRLAMNPGTTEEERRTAAMALARRLHDDDFFTKVRKAVDGLTALENWFKDNRRFFARHGIRIV